MIVSQDLVEVQDQENIEDWGNSQQEGNAFFKFLVNYVSKLRSQDQFVFFFWIGFQKLNTWLRSSCEIILELTDLILKEFGFLFKISVY